jgi:hypothetical protein
MGDLGASLRRPLVGVEGATAAMDAVADGSTFRQWYPHSQLTEHGRWTATEYASDERRVHALDEMGDLGASLRRPLVGVEGATAAMDAVAAGGLLTFRQWYPHSQLTEHGRWTATEYASDERRVHAHGSYNPTRIEHVQ